MPKRNPIPTTCHILLDHRPDDYEIEPLFLKSIATCKKTYATVTVSFLDKANQHELTGVEILLILGHGAPGVLMLSGMTAADLHDRILELLPDIENSLLNKVIISACFGANESSDTMSLQESVWRAVKTMGYPTEIEIVAYPFINVPKKQFPEVLAIQDPRLVRFHLKLNEHTSGWYSYSKQQFQQDFSSLMGNAFNYKHAYFNQGGITVNIGQLKVEVLDEADNLLTPVGYTDYELLIDNPDDITIDGFVGFYKIFKKHEKNKPEALPKHERKIEYIDNYKKQLLYIEADNSLKKTITSDMDDFQPIDDEEILSFSSASEDEVLNKFIALDGITTMQDIKFADEELADLSSYFGRMRAESPDLLAKRESPYFEQAQLLEDRLSPIPFTSTLS